MRATAMSTRRGFLSGIAGFGALSALGAGVLAAPLPAHIRSATAVTDVFGEGVKLVAVAIEYDRPVIGSKLSRAAFAVEGRTVTRVFTSRSTDPADAAPTGRFVIVALSTDDAGAALREPMRMGPPPAPRPPGTSDGPPRAPAGIGQQLPAAMAPRFKPAAAIVRQSAPIRVAGARTYPPTAAPVATSAVRELTVERFRQFQFRDPATGRTLKYNLYLPAGYDRRKTWPMVLFMHDAGVTGPDPLTTLRQGLGAAIWARPEEQAKRPCIVLAPQYEEVTVNDESQASSMREVTYALVEHIAATHAVDRDRIYSTGQSGGAMMTIALNIKYPTLFAASWIVAGQWDPALVKPMANDKLWIVVAEGDLKAFPGGNAITAALESEGAKVARATWDGRWNAAQFASAVASVEAQGAPINYSVLAKGTVVPPGQPDNGGSNHINTWRIAYTIEGIREWLFRQRR